MLDAGLLRRAGWGIGDQVLSSLSNFLVGLLIARSVDLATFGAFSLAFSAYLIAVSVSRAFPMSPLAIRYAAADRASFGRAAAAATGTAFGAGIAGGVLLVAIAAVTGGAFSHAFLALGITLPGLLLQDAWRSTFFASGRGRHAFLNDLVWVAIELPALAIILATASGSIFAIVAAWGGSACVAAIVGVLQARVVPSPLRARAWWREHADIASRFIAEAVARVASGQLMGYGVGAVIGLTAVGALRAGQLLFGPIQLVFFGVNQMAVPEASRAAAVSLGRLRQASVVAAGLLAVGAGVWTLIVLLMPTAVGEAILKDAWAPARDLAVPIGLTFVAGMLGFGGELGLRALAAAGRLLRVTVITSVLTLVLGVAGAAWGGASGCAWALFVVAVIGGLLFWLEYDRAEAERAVNTTPGHAAA